MSNLGMYQKIVEWSKKVGGPARLIALFMGGGYIVGRGCEHAIKKIIKALKEWNKESKSDAKVIYKIIEGTLETSDGLKFNIGDSYRILEIIDDEAALIEKIGDADNPYIVSINALREISNFK